MWVHPIFFKCIVCVCSWAGGVLCWFSICLRLAARWLLMEIRMMIAYPSPETPCHIPNAAESLRSFGCCMPAGVPPVASFFLPCIFCYPFFLWCFQLRKLLLGFFLFSLSAAVAVAKVFLLHLKSFFLMSLMHKFLWVWPHTHTLTHIRKYIYVYAYPWPGWKLTHVCMWIKVQRVCVCVCVWD